MTLLNRFSRLNDRGETGIFTFIVTKSVTRDFHRDATTKDFCFGYHRWAISFQRPAERVLGVHLLLRNPSPNTACVVDFSLALLNRDHFSHNQVYSKRQAKFTITNPMQGVSRWIQVSELNERRFSNETGEFLFELSLSNMRTIFECDIQLNPALLTQYKAMLKAPAAHKLAATSPSATPTPGQSRKSSEQLINLETNCFSFGSFDWSLTIVPLVLAAGRPSNPTQRDAAELSSSASSPSSNLLTPNRQQSGSSHSIASTTSSLSARDRRLPQSGQPPAPAQPESGAEPVCRVYLNRLNGFDSLCRVRYRVILGHHQPAATGQSAGGHSAEFVDSHTLDQISDSGGRIRGHQFRATNILKLISLRSAGQGAGAQQAAAHAGHQSGRHAHQHQQGGGSASLDLRVHIEMFCANTVSEARVPLHRKANEPPASNCSDRNKQSWCVESDCEGETVRLRLFFLDLQSVPRNHLRYISWSAYVVRRDPKSGGQRESVAVRHSPHSNYYLQDGIDLGTIMDTDIPVKEIHEAPHCYLDGGALTVHVEWIDSLLLFSHLYSNHDSLATVQRHQLSRELDALQLELETLEEKYDEMCKTLDRVQLADHRDRRFARPQTSTDTSPATSPTRQPSIAGALAARRLEERAESLQSAAYNKSPVCWAAGRPRNPMSFDERLQLSSSTPPGPSARPNPQADGRHSSPGQPECADGQLAPLSVAGPSGGFGRRRLPAQPRAAPLELATVGAAQFRVGEQQLLFAPAAVTPSGNLGVEGAGGELLAGRLAGLEVGASLAAEAEAAEHSNSIERFGPQPPAAELYLERHLTSGETAPPLAEFPGSSGAGYADGSSSAADELMELRRLSAELDAQLAARPLALVNGGEAPIEVGTPLKFERAPRDRVFGRPATYGQVEVGARVPADERRQLGGRAHDGLADNGHPTGDSLGSEYLVGRRTRHFGGEQHFGPLM